MEREDLVSNLPMWIVMVDLEVDDGDKPSRAAKRGSRISGKFHGPSISQKRICRGIRPSRLGRVPSHVMYEARTR